MQLQIAFAGVLIGVFGLIWKEWLLLGFGGLIALYGLVRYLILGRIVRENDLPDDLEQENEKKDAFFGNGKRKK